MNSLRTDLWKLTRGFRALGVGWAGALTLLAACGGGGGSDANSRAGLAIDVQLTPSAFAAAPAQALSFAAKCSGAAGITYEWAAGDGSSPVTTTEGTFTHRFAEEGEYLPRVICKDTRGGSAMSTSSAYVHVAVPLHTVSNVRALLVPGAAATMVTLSADCSGKPSDTFTYTWDFGDGTPGESGQIVSHSYLHGAERRQYTATVRCHDSRTGADLAGRPFAAPQVVAATATVVIGGADSAPLIAEPLTVEPITPTTAGPTTATFKCTATNAGVVTYAFTFDEGSVPQINTTGVATHTYKPDGFKKATQHTIKASCNQGGGGWSQTQTVLSNVRVPSLSLLAGRPADLFGSPMGVAVDANGIVYVADSTAHVIRKVTPAGEVSIWAGSGAASYADGEGLSASFNTPSGVAVDGDGNVYVADTGNNVIRKISSVGAVTTLAGSPVGAAGFVDGTGALAAFSAPLAIAVGATGTVYVADGNNAAIRKVSRYGEVSTHDLGVAADGTPASFDAPIAIAVDAKGNIFALTSGARDQTTTNLEGVVTTRYSGREGVAPAIAVGRDGAVYTASNNYVSISRNSRGATGGVWSSVGNGHAEPGFVDGVGVAASFREIRGLAVDGSGVLYFADTGNLAIRKVSLTGEVTTLAAAVGVSNGAGSSAAFSTPAGLAIDVVGNVFVADRINWLVRAINPVAVVSTLAGKRTYPTYQSLLDGPAADARFLEPLGVAVDGNKSVYVADTRNAAVRKISAEGIVTTLARASAPGVTPAVSLMRPSGVAVDTSGNVFVTDAGSIFKISAAGELTRISGSEAGFAAPSAIAINKQGLLIVADSGNHAIRTISLQGEVKLLAGGSAAGYQDGVGALAQFDAPTGVAVDSSGTIYVADSNNHSIRKVSPTGVVTTIVGTKGALDFQAGVLPGAIGKPYGIAISGRRLVFSANHYIGQIDFAP